MGRPLDGELIAKYAEEFARYPVLKARGFSMLVNMSGKLFINKKPSRKDVDANTEVEKKTYSEVFISQWIIVQSTVPFFWTVAEGG